MFRRAQSPTHPILASRVDVEQLSRNELLAHIEELRKHLQQVTDSRDRLHRENEDYINNSVSATFDSSSFLRETLLSRESELQQKNTELEHLKAERDELVEDVAMIKEAKRLSDRSCREATGNVTRMQQELQFYQKQAVDAMQARDRANGDVEQLRTRNSKLDTAASTCQADLKATEHSYAEAQQRLKDQEQEIADLKKRVENAAQVPTLELQVQRLQEALSSEQDSRMQVEAKLSSAEDELEARGQAVADLTGQASAAKEQHSALQAEIDKLQERVDQASAASALEHQSKDQESAALGPDGTQEDELAAARSSIKELTSQLNDMAAEKTQLLLEKAELEKKLNGGEEDEGAWGGWPWKRRPGSAQTSPSKTADSSPDT